MTLADLINHRLRTHKHPEPKQLSGFFPGRFINMQQVAGAEFRHQLFFNDRCDRAARFMNTLIDRAGTQINPQPLSGRDSVLLLHPPLRTAHTSFPVCGSSLYKPRLTEAGSYFLFTAVHLSMAFRMYYHEVEYITFSAVRLTL